MISIEEIMNSAKEKAKEEREKCQQRELGIRKEFNKRFGHMPIVNWSLQFEVMDDENKTDYFRADKVNSSFAIKGLSTWATHELLSGKVVLSVFEKIEEYAGELAQGGSWFCILEIKDKTDLIIISNFELRSELIHAV